MNKNVKRGFKPQQKKKTQLQEVETIIRTTARRGGFIFIDDNRIIIEKEDLNTALHEDTVKVQLNPKRGKDQTGKVVEVLHRARVDFVGTVQEEDGGYEVKMSDPKMYVPISISKADLGTASVGDKVLVTLDAWDDPRQSPRGTIERVIGKSGTHETEIQAIVLDKGFVPGFSAEVEEAAAAIKANYPTLLAQEEKTRRDFRTVTTFTIDPEDAKDFDDALSIQTLPNGNFEIGIHIADPTFFITPGSTIDKAAVEKTTSIYLVDRTIPMLPEVLSNDLCSLNANEDKLTFSAALEITPEGEVVDRWFGRTIIHSNRRFTYKEAQININAGTGDYAKELIDLNTLAQSLRKRRSARGAVEFNQEEVYFTLDKDGKPISIYKKEPLETHKLIEEFMILANQEVAIFMTSVDDDVERTFVYRIHDLPNEDKMRELFNLLRVLGYEVPQKTKEFTLKDINIILDLVAGTAHEHLVQMATVQSMSKAIYSTKNIGHFGLSLKHYTHFTSPIRRYPDMMVHRLIAKHLAGKEVTKEEMDGYEALSRYATQMEIAATKAQRESIKYKQTEYMADQVGKTFDGVITGLAEHGLYVRENDSLAEGMIRLKDLRDDYYSLDQKTFSIIGQRKKKKYSLGDAVKIKVTNVNVDKKLIDYVLVAE